MLMQTKGCARIMNVVAPKQKRWTGSRLDDLETKVGDGFAQVDKQFEKVDARFDRLDRKIDGLGYLLLTVALGYIATHAL
jgi:tetrahydromethanopterin S-methyltransferase subunit G